MTLSRIVAPSFVMITSPSACFTILSMPLGPRDVLTASESAFAASMFDILTSTFLESSLRKKEKKKKKTKERKKESVKNEKLIEQRDHLKNEKLLFSTRRKGRRKRKWKKREERRRKGEEENRQSSSLSLVLETHTHTRSRLARGPPRSTEVNQVIPRRGVADERRRVIWS